MAQHSSSTASAGPAEPSVDLKNPFLAAGLAWLWPGAGHVYQGRYAKGALFMICILGTFVFGLFIGEGRVVYASQEDWRWQYLFQLGVGAPALPALAQNAVWEEDKGSPYLVICRRNQFSFKRDKSGEVYDSFMAPPMVDPDPNRADMLAEWHKELGHRFEMGTLYTMIAGLLNILAIYDAFAGPAPARREEKDKPDDKGAGGGDEPTKEESP